MGKLGRGALALVVAAFATAGVAACGGGDDESGGGGSGSAKEGGTLTIAETSNPDFLDPAVAYTVEAAVAHWLIYPGLLTYKHEEGKAGAELQPGAADAMPKVSNGGKTYDFTMRKGLKYSDGQTAKASDFERTIQRSLTLEWGGLSFFETIKGAAEYVKNKKEGAKISGITADNKTGKITIELTEPNGQFPYILAFPSAGLVPSNTAFKNLSKDPPPGLGAYAFDNSAIEPNRSFALIKNKNFSDIPGIPKGNADRINVKLIKNQARQAEDVISGKLDWMLDEPSQDLLPEIRAKYKDRYEENTANSTYYMFFNVTTKPFDNVKVRQAANYAFDKSAAVRLFGGLLTPDCNFLPPGMQGYQKLDPCPWGDPNAAPDIEKARQLIEESGEKGAEVTVWGDDEERSKRITEYYADVLNKIGLKAKPKIIGAETYFATIGNKKLNPQTGFTDWFQDFPHPADFWFLLESGSIQPTNNQNNGQVADPEVDKLSAEIKRGQAADVADKSGELDKLVNSPEKAYVLPYGHTKDTTFVSERMDLENCTVYHPVYRDDWSQFCLK
jgi:peptide/nickel transport system substrate-binding protein